MWARQNQTHPIPRHTFQDVRNCKYGKDFGLCAAAFQLFNFLGLELNPAMFLQFPRGRLLAAMVHWLIRPVRPGDEPCHLSEPWFPCHENGSKNPYVFPQF